MLKINEKFYGPDTEKVAKTYWELGIAYEQWNNLNDAIGLLNLFLCRTQKNF